MARAMRASGERNPNAMRVRSRILVLVDSISPWDRPWSRAASMASRCRTMRSAQLDEYRDAAAPRPGDPPVQGLLAFLALDRKHMPQALFEQIGAIQAGVGLGDPGQLGGLAFGEVFGVLPQRITGALELAGPLMAGTRRGVLGGAPATPFGLAAGQRPRVVPGPAALGIECLGGPGHHMERVGTADRGRAAFGHHVGDPVRGVGGHVGDLRTPLGARARRRTGAGWRCRGPARPTPAGRCRGRPPPSGSGGGACRRSHRSRFAADSRTGRRACRCRPRPGPRSPPRCARRSASARTPRFSSTPPPATPPCHRRPKVCPA